MSMMNNHFSSSTSTTLCLLYQTIMSSELFKISFSFLKHKLSKQFAVYFAEKCTALQRDASSYTDLCHSWLIGHSWWNSYHAAGLPLLLGCSIAGLTAGSTGLTGWGAFPPATSSQLYYIHQQGSQVPEFKCVVETYNQTSYQRSQWERNFETLVHSLWEWVLPCTWQLRRVVFA